MSIPNSNATVSQPAQLPGLFGTVLELPPVTSKTRLESLSDGVFAVAMTLLVLDVKVPSFPSDVTSVQLGFALLALWPKIGAFVLSFLFLSRIWYVNRFVFHTFERVDYALYYTNVFNLLLVCFVPFSTSLVAEHPHVNIAASIYAANITAVALCNGVMWFHAARHRELFKSEITDAIAELFTRRYAVVVGAYLLSLPISYFSGELSILWIFILQMIYQLKPFFVLGNRFELKS